MSDTSPRLEVPYIQAAQAQKHVTHNEALRVLDLLVQLSVEAFDATTPPSLPQEGAVYALGVGASGAWSGHDGELALYVDGYWDFHTPAPGWIATLVGNDKLRIWTGSAWEAPSVEELENLTKLGVNTTADTTNRLAVSSPATLFSHEGAGHQLKVNKASVGDTASLLFQDNWSGRAEMGLAGSDTFSIKVSADGSTWAEALTIDPVTGHLSSADAELGNLVLTQSVASLATAATDVVVYDTTRDSDGGAWRQRCQHMSWYNEPLNSATRGARREFPAVAVIVAEVGKVTIHDADDPALPMWMVVDFPGSSVTSLAARNGAVMVGLATTGVTVLDFAADALDVTARYATGTSPAIIANTVHAIAATVHPRAPAEPTTGLSVPTLAVATEGDGTYLVSIVQSTGAVFNLGADSGYTATGVSFRDDGALILLRSDGKVFVWKSPEALAADGAAPSETYSATSIPALFGTATKTAAGRAFGSTSGLALMLANPGTSANSMVARVAHDYTTGWMPGDITGTFLSDTDDTDLVGSGELVTNGTFDADISGWIPTTPETVLTHSSGRLRVESATSGVYGRAAATFPTVVGKTYRIQIEGYAGTGTPYVYVGSSAGSPDYVAFRPNTGPKTFVAVGPEAHITLYNNTSPGAFYSEYDNISVKLADADRSVNGHGIVVNGTITREAVATGAELVAYSGFSAGNYLEGTHTSYVPTLYALGWEQDGGIWAFKHGVASSTPIDGLTITGNTLKIAGTKPKALIRLTTTTPSVEQLTKIEADERFLFQANAACTLYGASDSVAALAHDPVTGLLHVGTSAGRSDFQGLRRVDNTTTAITTAIAASGGLIVEQ